MGSDGAWSSIGSNNYLVGNGYNGLALSDGSDVFFLVQFGGKIVQTIAGLVEGEVYTLSWHQRGIPGYPDLVNVSCGEGLGGNNRNSYWERPMDRQNSSVYCGWSE
jgi:hypothetical protein